MQNVAKCNKNDAKKVAKKHGKTRLKCNKKWHFGFLPLKNPLHPLALRALLHSISTRALYRHPWTPTHNLRCPLQFAVQGPSPSAQHPRCSLPSVASLGTLAKFPKENKGPNPRNPLPDTDTGG